MGSLSHRASWEKCVVSSSNELLAHGAEKLGQDEPFSPASVHTQKLPRKLAFLLPPSDEEAGSREVCPLLGDPHQDHNPEEHQDWTFLIQFSAQPKLTVARVWSVYRVQILGFHPGLPIQTFR